jgi:hypothetical protein
MSVVDKNGIEVQTARMRVYAHRSGNSRLAVLVRKADTFGELLAKLNLWRMAKKVPARLDLAVVKELPDGGQFSERWGDYPDQGAVIEVRFDRKIEPKFFLLCLKSLEYIVNKDRFIMPADVDEFCDLSGIPYWICPYCVKMGVPLEGSFMTYQELKEHQTGEHNDPRVVIAGYQDPA